MRILFFITFFSLISVSAFAQSLAQLPNGATLLNISATENIEVDQDTLIANLRVEKQLSDPKELQQEINMMMKQAVEEAKKIEGLTITTEQYYVHQYQRDNKQLWQGNQGLSIKSQKADDVLELSGRLQDMGFLMNGLNYQLSPEKYEEIRESLLEGSIKKLMARAKRVGSAIDKPNVDLWELNVDAAPTPNYPQPVMMARGMAMESMGKSAMAPPVAEAGKSTVSMSVSAKMILK